MQLSDNHWNINKEALMDDWRYFGFDSLASAENYKEQMTTQIIKASEGLEGDGVPQEQAQLLMSHMDARVKLLS